ncbi:MAG TPA: HAD family hydrolase [Pirellulales bacterium]|nr:HAD family hydrolase [Pirellulales bacterium]
MTTESDLVFLFDVDNTLLDNDHVQKDLAAHLEKEFGDNSQKLYWQLFEELRSELGYADYLGALQRYRRHEMYNPQMLRMSSFLVDYPFAERVYPGALEAVAHVRRFGRTAILSDGDVVFQPRKVERSGLWKAFDGHVLIYIHKEQELDNVAQSFPARHYVLVDDKLRILTAVKNTWGDRVTTVFPRQGHYALDEKEVAKYPAADVTLDSIGELADPKLDTLWASLRGRPGAA